MAPCHLAGVTALTHKCIQAHLSAVVFASFPLGACMLSSYLLGTDKHFPTLLSKLTKGLLLGSIHNHSVMHTMSFS